MKVAYTAEATPDELVTIHFPCELPTLVPMWRSRPWMPSVRCRLSRNTPLAGLGEHLARINRGRTVVELACPEKTFRDFTAELIVVPGLIELVTGDRYSLTIKIGRCFETRSVCQAVAACVLRHFYPDDTAVVEQLTAADPLSAQNHADRTLVVSAYR